MLEYEVHLRDECCSTNSISDSAITNDTAHAKKSLWKRFVDSGRKTWNEGVDAVSMPVVKMMHKAKHFPAYIEASLMLGLAMLVDKYLVWLVVVIFLLKVLWWAIGKLFNNWVDGFSASDNAAGIELLDNGDVIIHR